MQTVIALLVAVTMLAGLVGFIATHVPIQRIGLTRKRALALWAGSFLAFVLLAQVSSPPAATTTTEATERPATPTPEPSREGLQSDGTYVTSTGTRYSASEQEAVREAVAVLLEGGLVQKVDHLRGDYHVNPFLWAALNVDQKEQIAQGLARWREISGSHAPVIEIYDYQSGRELAGVGVFSGFYIEE